MTAFEKYKRLMLERIAARDAGNLLDETEAYFAQALDDCHAKMSEKERADAERMFGDTDTHMGALLSKATDAVRAADQALAKAVEAFEVLHASELALFSVSRGVERDIANRGWARADVSLAVLRMLGTE